MKQISLILIGLFFSVVQSVVATEFDFNAHVFADWGNKQGQTSLVDIDKDGDLDWVVGRRSNEVSWFEFQNATTWIRHTLGTSALTDVGGVAFDIDGDGWIDQASGAVWYKNPGTPRETLMVGSVGLKTKIVMAVLGCLIPLQVLKGICIRLHSRILTTMVTLIFLLERDP